MLILSYNVFDMNIEVLKLVLSMTHGESMENYLVSFSGFGCLGFLLYMNKAL